MTARFDGSKISFLRKLAEHLRGPCKTFFPRLICFDLVSDQGGDRLLKLRREPRGLGNGLLKVVGQLTVHGLVLTGWPPRRRRQRARRQEAQYVY